MAKIAKVEIYDYKSEDHPSETVGSFIEAVELCARKAIYKVVFYLADNFNMPW